MDINEKNPMITFRLRKGIKFHDGSDFNADAVAYNFKWLKDVKRLQFGDKVKSIEVLDPYTVRLHLTEYNNQLIHGLGWVFMWSKQALTTKSPDWLRANPVGTGPFKLVEWRRDDHVKWERNKDYWQKGRPYLDGIEVRYVPDPVTASADDADETGGHVDECAREGPGGPGKEGFRAEFWLFGPHSDHLPQYDGPESSRPASSRFAKP